MGEHGGEWGNIGGNGEEHRENESQCLQLHFLPGLWGLLLLSCLWLTMCTPLRVCGVSPSKPEPRTKIGVCVCKIFVT